MLPFYEHKTQATPTGYIFLRILPKQDVNAYRNLSDFLKQDDATIRNNVAFAKNKLQLEKYAFFHKESHSQHAFQLIAYDGPLESISPLLIHDDEENLSKVVEYNSNDLNLGEVKKTINDALKDARYQCTYNNKKVDRTDAANLSQFQQEKKAVALADSRHKHHHLSQGLHNFFHKFRLQHQAMHHSRRLTNR